MSMTPWKQIEICWQAMVLDGYRLVNGSLFVFVLEQVLPARLRF